MDPNTNKRTIPSETTKREKEKGDDRPTVAGDYSNTDRIYTFCKIFPVTLGKGIAVSASPTSSNMFFKRIDLSATSLSTENSWPSEDVSLTVVVMVCD
jgi:hypothetical protein